MNITDLFEKQCCLIVNFFSECFVCCQQSLKSYLAWLVQKISRRYAPREAISPGERLSVMLRYLVTGDAFSTIAANYRLSDTRE